MEMMQVGFLVVDFHPVVEHEPDRSCSGHS